MSSKISDIVLVVDDSPESLGMLNAALNTQGYTALVALNGVQALAIIDKVECPHKNTCTNSKTSIKRAKRFRSCR